MNPKLQKRQTIQFQNSLMSIKENTRILMEIQSSYKYLKYLKIIEFPLKILHISAESFILLLEISHIQVFYVINRN